MLTMKLQIHSWNVRGLEMSDRNTLLEDGVIVLKGKILFVYKK